MDARDMVMGYLRTLMAQGTAQLRVDDEARGILRSWMLAAKQGRTAAPNRGAAAPAASVPPPSATDAPAPAPTPEKWRSLSDDTEPVAVEEHEEEEIPFFRPGGQSAEEAWAAMEQLLPRWEPLRRLQTLRPQAVFGSGNRHADIMFVGEMVTYYDEINGKPFQGPSGEKLDGMLKAMGLTRDEVYLTQLVKFRPDHPRQTKNTRTPSEKEVKFSLPVLDFEIALVQPKVIVALGIIPARTLLRLGQLPLSDYQNKVHDYRGTPVVVTHKPSYLLRTSDRAERRRLWEDMLRVMEIAQLPISPKQRGFFLPKEN